MAAILVVEGDDVFRQTLSQTVADNGHAVSGVATIADAASQLSSKRYDLLISNVRLADGGGGDLLLQADALGIRTLLMTGDPSSMLVVELKAVARLKKPFQTDELMRVITWESGA